MASRAWRSLPAPPTPRPGLRGVAVAEADARGILTRASGFIEEYDYTLNPYGGCSFGCSYCYAAFFSRTPGRRDGWGGWVEVKRNAVELLRKKRPGSLDGKRIYMSSVTDPYQPIERKAGITRGLLEIMAERNPVGEPLHRPRLVVQTRSPDVARDCDLFRAIEANGGRVRVNMTVTTDDEDVRRAFEPSCPANARRLDAIREVREAGVEACVTMTPLLLVRDAEAFAERLLATGVREYVVQSFQFARGRFVASTREGALALMADKLGCGPAEVHDRYLAHYEAARAVLEARLTAAGAALGEGKEGFAPPF